MVGWDGAGGGGVSGGLGDVSTFGAGLGEASTFGAGLGEASAFGAGLGDDSSFGGGLGDGSAFGTGFGDGSSASGDSVVKAPTALQLLQLSHIQALTFQ